MSILLQATEELTANEWAFMSVLAAGGLLGAWAVGAFRTGSLATERMQPHRLIGALAVPFLAGAIVFFAVQALYGAYLGITRSTPTQPFDQSQFSTGDWVFAASVPQLAALLAIVACHAVGAGGGLGQLGLRARQIPAGVAWGIAGTLIILPLVFSFSMIVEELYKWVGYEHPMEHDLLRIMEQTGPVQRIVLLLAITVFAPLTEELLFRGHLQTLLRRLLGTYRLSPHRPDLPPSPLDPAQAPWTAWVAILTTSALFSVIHPIWSAPPIFLLSVALGFAYERTGNLWVSIIMHTLFNASSTMMFWASTR